MRHTITIEISEEAQRRALIAGESAKLVQTYEIPATDIAGALDLPWVHISERGEVTCDVTRYLYFKEDENGPLKLMSSGTGIKAAPCPTRPQSAEAAIAYAWAALSELNLQAEHSRQEHRERESIRAAEEERRQAEEQANANAWAALLLDERASVDGVYWSCPVTGGIMSYRTLQQHVPAALAEAEAHHERLRAEHAAHATAVAEQYVAADRALLVEHGTENQVARYDAGVLPLAEFGDLVWQVHGASLRDIPRYELLAPADLAHEHHDCGTVKFRTAEYSGPYTAERWEGLQAIRAKAPEGAEITVRAHVAYCTECDATCERLGVKVAIEFAGDVYSREYAF